MPVFIAVILYIRFKEERHRENLSLSSEMIQEHSDKSMLKRFIKVLISLTWNKYIWRPFVVILLVHLIPTLSVRYKRILANSHFMRKRDVQSIDLVAIVAANFLIFIFAGRVESLSHRYTMKYSLVLQILASLLFLFLLFFSPWMHFLPYLVYPTLTLLRHFSQQALRVSFQSYLSTSSPYPLSTSSFTFFSSLLHLCIGLQERLSSLEYHYFEHHYFGALGGGAAGLVGLAWAFNDIVDKGFEGQLRGHKNRYANTPLQQELDEGEGETTWLVLGDLDKGSGSSGGEIGGIEVKRR